MKIPGPTRQQVFADNRLELHVLLRGYRLYAGTEGLSPKTIRLTSSVVMLFRDFLYQAGYTTDASKIDVTEIREFILYLQQVPAYENHPRICRRRRPLTGHTVNTYLRSLRAFFSWLVREGSLKTNPFFKLRIPKPPRKVIPTFSPEQIRRLLAVIPPDTSTGIRDRTVVQVLLDTGVRLSELLNMKVDDVDFEQGMIKVFGKGSKERRVAIGSRSGKAIWDYVHKWRPEPKLPRYDYLFLRPSGTRLDAVMVERLIRGYGEAARIKGVRCSPHTFRHTFAITFLRNGGDVFSLQAQLGHAGLDIVKTYVNVAQSDVKAAHVKYSPLDNLEMD